MPLLIWIILFTALGGVLSVVAAANFLLVPESMRTRLLPALLSFAIGALLGAAFLALLPHALEMPGADAHDLMVAVLAGLLGFLLLEKVLLWRHGRAQHRHDQPHDGHDHSGAAGYLILLGDGIHNFVDGVLIASAFMTDVHLGIVTALAVAAHEIPHEIGDFAILLHSGFSKGKALAYNVLSGLTTVVGGVIAYFFLSTIEFIVPYVLAVAAASFIYIAVADLIPGMQRRAKTDWGVSQFVLILAGVGVIYLAHLGLD